MTTSIQKPQFVNLIESMDNQSVAINTQEIVYVYDCGGDECRIHLTNGDFLRVKARYEPLMFVMGWDFKEDFDVEEFYRTQKHLTRA